MSEAPPVDWQDVEQGSNVRALPTPAADVPHDQNAERAVLGAVLLRPEIVPEIAAILRDDDWWLPAHQAIWQEISDRAATGQPGDVLNVAAAVGTHRTVIGLGGPLYLNDLANDPNVLPSEATWHARIVAAKAQERRTEALGRWLQQAAQNGTDPETIAARMERHLGDRNVADKGDTIPNVDELLAQDTDDEPAWIVPDLLERGDRVILTAGEGTGKSTLLRQVGVMCAAGIHPFRGVPMEPLRVLLIDLENSARQTRRKIRPLRLQVGRQLEPDRLHIEVRIQGLDLTDAADIAWLSRAVARHKPDLLITGPVYKMANGDPNEEKSAKPVAMALDRIRAEHDVAVLLEAHSAKAPAGQKRRPREPYGWSGWMRWPEFGLHLDDDGTISHWRGQRDERDWPELLLRGGHWPWTVAQAEPDMQWTLIHQAITGAGERLTNRELARRTGIPETTVRRLVDRYSQRMTSLLNHLSEVRRDDD